jgi:hypothetical protein
MNRFERECQVSPSLFRRTRDQLGRVDPLAIRQARTLYLASCRRRGAVPTVGIGKPSPDVIRAMDRNEWRAMLWHMLACSPLVGPARIFPTSEEETAEVAELFAAQRLPYQRLRWNTFTHDEALAILEYRGTTGKRPSNAETLSWQRSQVWLDAKAIIDARSRQRAVR